MHKLLTLQAFSLLLLVPAAQNAFADTMVIGADSQVTVEAGSTLQIDSDDNPNTLTNKGQLTVEDGGSVVLSQNGQFFNDCDATANLAGTNAMQIGSLGAMLANIINHGSIFGPGQISFVADSMEVQNSNVFTAILNPVFAILDIATICGDNPAEEIQELIDTVDGYVDSGEISSRNAGAISWLLDAALSFQNDGDSASADNRLERFESRVNQFKDRGLIDETVGDELISMSRSITFTGLE